MLRSDSTRHLSAGTYLDADFRNAVLHELLGRRDGAVAPAFSTDAVPVVRHALNARRHQIARDVVLTGILLVFLVIQAKVLLAVLALAGALLLSLRALRALLRGHVVQALVLLFPIGLALLVAALLFESRSGLFSSINGSSGYDENIPFGTFVLQVLSVVVVVLGSAWTVVVIERLVNRQVILDHLLAQNFVPGESPTGPKGRQARIRYIAQAQTGNVSYYPQDSSDQPFVGAGIPQHTWTRAVPLSAVSPSFTTETVHEALSVALARLNQGKEEISVQDRLITPATARSGDSRTEASTGLLRHRLSPDEMQQLAEADPTGTQQYLSVRMAPDRGAYEIWVFVRCLIQAETLHLDLIGCCLPPVRANYREIDQYAQSGGGAVLRTAFGVLPELLGLILRAPLRLFLVLTNQDRAPGDLASRLRQIGSSASTGRGVRAGVRELGTDQTSSDLLAGLAMQRHIRLIEQQILTTIATSLEQSGLDAEEFRRRTRTIVDGPDQ